MHQDNKYVLYFSSQPETLKMHTTSGRTGTLLHKLTNYRNSINVYVVYICVCFH